MEKSVRSRLSGLKLSGHKLLVLASVVPGPASPCPSRIAGLVSSLYYAIVVKRLPMNLADQIQATTKAVVVAVAMWRRGGGCDVVVAAVDAEGSASGLGGGCNGTSGVSCGGFRGGCSSAGYAGSFSGGGGGGCSVIVPCAFVDIPSMEAEVLLSMDRSRTE